MQSRQKDSSVEDSRGGAGAGILQAAEGEEAGTM